LKIKSHIKVADVLLSKMSEQNNNIINKNIFKLGSIMPDISPHLRFMHHHFIRNANKLQKYNSKINITKSSIRLSYILGKLTHYISDSFLLVHNIDFKSNLILHRKYENKFSKYLKDDILINDKYFSKSYLHVNCLIDVLFERLNQYLKQYIVEEISMQNFYNDLMYIIHVNSEIINAYINQFNCRLSTT